MAQTATNQWPRYSGYQSLQHDGKYIRLLMLQKGATPKNLQYTMQHVELHRSTKYVAVSYSWGAPVPATALKRISIHGEAVLVRPTLYRFLKNMANQQPLMSMWIDCLSIDQTNVNERNHQISIMGDIYRTAEDVCVWLGPGDDETDYVLEHAGTADPSTPFEPVAFAKCAQKLFRANYWTRRWVIQEFALARDLTIVCGKHLVKWQDLTKKVGPKVLDGDVSAQNTFRNFNQLQSMISQNQLGLLELMERFENAGCVDVRDRAFALRSIAHDGHLLTPDYNESAADIYFRILSMLPTQRVLPNMWGYRWPDQAASLLLNLLNITGQELLSGLNDKPDDRLYAVFEYRGTIANVQDSWPKDQPPPSKMSFPSFVHEIKLRGSGRRELMSGRGNFRPGDLVYSLQTTPSSPKGLYIAFSSSYDEAAVVGLLISRPDIETVSYWTRMGLPEARMQQIGGVVSQGVIRCSRNKSARLTDSRIVCHINRRSLLLMWTMDYRLDDDDLECYQTTCHESVESNLLCRCLEEEFQYSENMVGTNGLKNDCIEILPAFHTPDTERLWTVSSPYSRDVQGSGLLNRVPDGYKGVKRRWQHPERIKFRYDSHTELQFAAIWGYFKFTKQLLSDRHVMVNKMDERGRTPLLLASIWGEDALVELLLNRGDIDLDCEDKDHGNALSCAIKYGHDRVVKVLLDCGKFHPSLTFASGHLPLTLAVVHRKESVVQILLDSEEADPSEKDGFGYTALVHAAACGHHQIVKMLLDSNQVDQASTDHYNRNALFLGAENGHADVVKLLCSTKEADPDSRSVVQQTPLFMAAQNGHAEVVQLLLDTGRVSTSSKDKFGRTPVTIAVEKGHTNIVQMLQACANAHQIPGQPSSHS